MTVVEILVPGDILSVFYFYNDFFALKFETAPFLSFSPEKVLWQINSRSHTVFKGQSVEEAI